MKKFFCICLALIMIPGMFAACAEQSPVETVPETQPETTEAPTEETVPIIRDPDGFLFFTVSERNFSIVGEYEDIYVGSIPTEDITWETDDDSVALFDSGRITAAGVGSTTVRAIAGNKQLECKVSCLAEDTDALMELDSDTLRSPLRMPPIVENYNPAPYYKDAVLVGDSITWMLFQHELSNKMLDNPMFLCRGGVSINGFVKYFKNLYFQGSEAHIEDIIAGCGKKKIFILLGQNDLGYQTVEETLSNYELMLNRIREKAPDVEFYLQTCLPEWCKDYDSNEKNEHIDHFNYILDSFAQRNDCHLVKLDPYFEDHLNRMATMYTSDYSIHMNEVGSVAWINVLTAYAYLQQMEVFQ